MSSTIYKIQLKPLGTYFFGSERNFRSTVRKKNYNYFVVSEKYPQQTSLLGMLRMELLIQNGQFPITDKGQAERLIGSSSFSVKEALSHKDQELGVIKQLSPTYLSDSGQKLFPCPFEYCEKPKKEKDLAASYETIEPSFSAGVSSIGTSTKDEVCLVENKNYYKEGFLEWHYSLEQKKPLVANEDLFKYDQIIGIDKKRKNEAFYKLGKYRLRDACCFEMYLELDDANEDRAVKLDSSVIHMGGESSSFAMTVSPVKSEADHSSYFETKESFSLAFEKKKNARIILLSDAFVDNKIYDACRIAFIEQRSFRQLTSSVGVKRNHNNQVKSKAYHLIKRGSVFYPENIGEVQKVLNNAALQKIGFNHFVTIEKS